MKRAWMLALLLLLFAVPSWAALWKVNLWTNAATDTTAVGMADSSNCIFTYGAQHVYLTIKPNLGACRLAILVKSCGDSSASSGALSEADTSKAGVFQWHQFDGASVTAAPDSNRIGVPGAPTNTTTFMAGEELVIQWPAEAAGIWGTARAVTIPLVDNLANPFLGTIQIRVRNLNAPGVVRLDGHLTMVTAGP